MDNKTHKAHIFAKEKHKGQKRKFTDIEYITHSENTANILWQENESAESDDFIAALLHDVVEDTKTTIKEVGQLFGKIVMDLVEELTSDKEQQNSKGKSEYLTEKINNMSERAFTVKLCDRLDNVVGLKDTRITTEFREKYIKETRYIIKHLNREINRAQNNLLNRIKAMLLYFEIDK